MTALTDRVRTAIEARLQVARAATGLPSIKVQFYVDDDVLAKMEAHLQANGPDVVARSCEADLRMLETLEAAGVLDWDKMEPIADPVMRNLKIRYGVSDGD